jgi:hypothetical protein
MESSTETDAEYDPQRKFRAPDDEWVPFEAATRAVHPEGRSPRGRVIREFIRWYMRRPGAKLPERPAEGPWSRSSLACGAANYSDRCELPAGHTGRHREGVMTWPQGVERPVSPARSKENSA